MMVSSSKDDATTKMLAAHSDVPTANIVPPADHCTQNAEHASSRNPCTDLSGSLVQRQGAPGPATAIACEVVRPAIASEAAIVTHGRSCSGAPMKEVAGCFPEDLLPSVGPFDRVPSFGVLAYTIGCFRLATAESAGVPSTSIGSPTLSSGAAVVRESQAAGGGHSQSRMNPFCSVERRADGLIPSAGLQSTVCRLALAFKTRTQ
mmetsp:Transcript_11708/g.29667  ORF Transcript_11708/g.29667 Transcript_11708/m.29667 type:complete len:205 (+) Transcript_11708:280-894(+)